MSDETNIKNLKIPAVNKKIFIIGKKDNFIYVRKYMDENGNVISDSTFTEVVLNPDFPENEFIVPKNYQSFIADSPAQISGFLKPKQTK